MRCRTLVYAEHKLYRDHYNVLFQLRWLMRRVYSIDVNIVNKIMKLVW